PGADPLVHRSHGLGRVLDERDPVPLGDSGELVHPGHIAVEIYRDDCAGSRRNALLDRGRIQAAADGIDVAEYGCRAQVCDAGATADPCAFGQNHLVAFPDTEGRQQEVDRRRAVRRHDSVPATVIGCEFGLEPLAVVVGVLVPAVPHRVLNDLDLMLGDPRPRHVERLHRLPLRVWKSITRSLTERTSISVSSGYIGSEITSAAERSVSGSAPRSPATRVRYAR